MPRPWSELSDEEKLDRLARVLTRAGADEQFRSACLDPLTGQKEIETEADVIFDNVTVRCVPDKETAEKEILLRLPDRPAPEGEEHRPESGWWMCSYTTYNPHAGG